MFACNQVEQKRSKCSFFYIIDEYVHKYAQLNHNSVFFLPCLISIIIMLLTYLFLYLKKEISLEGMYPDVVNALKTVRFIVNGNIHVLSSLREKVIDKFLRNMFYTSINTFD